RAHPTIAQHEGTPAGAQQGEDVDAEMTTEVPVLLQQRRFDDRRRDLPQRRPQAIFVVGGEGKPQELSRDVVVRPREGNRAGQRRAKREKTDEEKPRRRDAALRRPPPAHQSPSTTSLAPPTPIACTLRSYIDSENVGGITNDPRFVARMR